jgi:hypothetical protein
MTAVAQSINIVGTSDGPGLELVLALAELAAARGRAVAHLDEALARVDALTAMQVAGIRADCERLGLDDERTERVVAAFVARVVAPSRCWFVRERNRAALGIVRDVMVAPPQV